MLEFHTLRGEHVAILSPRPLDPFPQRRTVQQSPEQLEARDHWRTTGQLMLYLFSFADKDPPSHKQYLSLSNFMSHLRNSFTRHADCPRDVIVLTVVCFYHFVLWCDGSFRAASIQPL